MKKIKLVTIMVVVVLLLTGCSIPAKQKPAEIQRMARSFENEILPKVNEEIERVQPQVVAITEAVQGQNLSGDDLSDMVAMLQTANAASAPFNPYAVPVGAALTLLSAVLGIFARNKTKEAAIVQRKYTAHKQGVERAIKTFKQHDNVTPETVELNLYDSIGLARTNNGV